MVLALACPSSPLPELWFGQIATVHQGNDTVYGEPLHPPRPRTPGIALDRLSRFPEMARPPELLTLALLLLYVYGGITEKWS